MICGCFAHLGHNRLCQRRVGGDLATRRHRERALGSKVVLTNILAGEGQKFYQSKGREVDHRSVRIWAGSKFNN